MYRYGKTLTVNILPGLKALGNNRALAPRRVDISQAAATLPVVWLLAAGLNVRFLSR
ncbi:MAG: hypothetical protein MGG11_14085 [Trichodesmium sp. MAG_R03]|nr:hypothetical protein [Trichodesmium sp. MAG_R03]